MASQPVLGSQWTTLTTGLTTVHTTAHSTPPGGQVLFTWTVGGPSDADVTYWSGLYDPVYTNITTYNSSSPVISSMQSTMADSLDALNGLEGFVPSMITAISTLININGQLMTMVNDYLADIPTLVGSLFLLRYMTNFHIHSHMYTLSKTS